MKILPAIVICSVVLLAAACGDSAETGPQTIDTQQQDMDQSGEDTTPRFADTTDDLDSSKYTDHRNVDYLGGDSEVVGLDTGYEGSFGWPCEDGDECISGYCVESQSGQVCTTICITECPEGWECIQDTAATPDLIFVCLPNFLSLCMPCMAHVECYSSGFDTGARCVDLGGAGAFCGAKCTDEAPCPPGWVCDEADLVSGQTATQCVPVDDECDCTEYATNKNAMTSCYFENEDGLCPGVRNCAADGLSDCDAATPAAEDCNGIDDDCDGDVDEALGTTTCGLGICEHTIDNCTEGIGQDCDPLEGSQYEICNGMDDSCDGNTDEGYLDTDIDGIADCLEADDDGDGVPDDLDNCPKIENEDQADFDLDTIGDVCDPDDDNDLVGDEDDCQPFNNDIHPGADEVCNDLDDDCDGDVDENMGETTCGLGVCEHSVEACEGGVSTACDPLEGSSEEACDGLDNDCDGAADNGFSDLDEDGEADCMDLDDDGDGVDDLDDNCPEVPNEDQADFDDDGAGDACDEDDDDDTSPDELDCEPLNPAVFPGAAEVCNGESEDCDDDVDEGLGTTTCGLGPCEHTVDNCLDGVPQDCDPFEGSSDEVCDGEDNDCNGVADNGFPDLDQDGEADCVDLDDDGDGVDDLDDNCPEVPNEDQADLDDDGAGDACDEDDDGDDFNDDVDCQPLNPMVFPGAPEVCNGVDDDCDDEIDEELGVAVCGLGPCEHMVPVCLDGVPQECDPFEGSLDEECDGVDTDCDGLADNGFPDQDQDGEADCMDLDDDGDDVPDDEDCEPLNPEIPSCAGKVCGDDGCGDSCGSCGGGTTCADGECVCLPNCAGKNCGSDGCGGICGSCGSNYTCSGGTCTCVPNCSGKSCGSNGCGGSCGGCSWGYYCSGYSCKCGPPPGWGIQGGQCKPSCGKLLNMHNLPNAGAGCCNNGCNAQQAGDVWSSYDCKNCCASWSDGGGCSP